MNLFQNSNLIQAVRDAYELSIPQATAVLIAYQHGSVSTLSVRVALGYNAKVLASSGAVSVPVRRGVLKEQGKTRVKHASRPVSVYRLVDPEGLYEIIDNASRAAVAMFQIINQYEKTAQENLDNESR